MTGRDLVFDAARGIKLYRVRSWLTGASFAAGTAAAVALFAITDGARAELLRRIEALGADLVAIRPVGDVAERSAPPLVRGDVDALVRGLPFVRTAVPVRWLRASVLLPDQRVAVRVIETTAGYFDLLKIEMRRGAPFADGDPPANSCVLGAGAARALVPSGDPYGSLVKIGGNWYRVVGVLASDTSVSGASGMESESAGREVYLPISDTFREGRSLREIWLRIDPAIDPEVAAPIIERTMLRRHEGLRHFEVATPQQLLRQQRAARGLLDLLLGIISAGAFLLGGIAMMATSWQSIVDRTSEIAIRRAVGARREEILAQFVLEGLTIAVLGAAGGAFLGALGSGLASLLAGWPWRLSAARLLFSLAIAVGVGLLSSWLPARRASSLDPAVALRFER